MEMFFGDGRVFRRVDGVGVNWSIDLREDGVRSPATAAVTGPAERERRAAMRLRFLPLTLAVRSGVARVESDHGTLQLVGINGALSESTVSKATVGSVEVRAGARSYVRRGLRAATSWRDGVAFFSDIALAESVVLRTLVASVADPAGTSLSLDLSVGSGDVRGDVSLTTRAGLLEIDLALSAAELPLESVAKLIGLSEPFGGVVREGRVTWRGTPGRWADSEIALRLEVEGLTRRGERWDSLVMGANFIGRRLYLSNFQLAAAENRVTANGEIAVPRGEAGWLDSSFLLNVSADVREVRKLAVFAGDWWRDVEGRLSLHGSVSGVKGRMDGYANGEASGLTLRGLPPASLKFSSVLDDRELEVRSAELWSGADRVSAKGTVGVEEPHRYSGEITGTMADVSRFTGRLGGAAAKWLESGGFTISWQGDGTESAHSGVFRAALADAATRWTPTGITGEVEGSYSPENVYLSRLRVQNGALVFNTRLTVSNSGVNLADLSLKRGELEILAGEAFVPADLFALLRGERSGEAFDLTKAVYARIASDDLPLAELVAMAGQDAVAEGVVVFSLEANGPLPELALRGSISGRGLSATKSGYQVPKTAVDLAISSRDRRLFATGAIVSAGFEPLIVDAAMPFSFHLGEDGWVRFFNRADPISANVAVPRTDLKVLGAILPGVERTAGTLVGTLSASGTVDAPEFGGELELSDGRFGLSALPGTDFEALDGKIRLSGSRAELTDVGGQLGGGEVTVAGHWDARSAQSLHVEVMARDVTLRALGFRGQADFDLLAVRQDDAGLVSGSVRARSGAVGETITLAVAPVGDRPAVTVGHREPERKRPDWLVDVEIDVGKAVTVGGESEAGSLSGTARLHGPIDTPRLSAALRITDLIARSASGWPLPVSGRWFLDGVRGANSAFVGSGQSVIAGKPVEYRVAGPVASPTAWVVGLGGLNAVRSSLEGHPSVEWSAFPRSAWMPPASTDAPPETVSVRLLVNALPEE